LFIDLFNSFHLIVYANQLPPLLPLSIAARNGVLNDPSKSLRILQMPLPLETAFNILRCEAELLIEVLGDGKHDATLSALRSLLKKKRDEKVKQETVVEKQEDQGIFSGLMDSWNGCLAGGFSFDELFCGGDLGNVDNGKQIEVEKDNAESSMIYTMGDAKCHEDLVYAVEVNPNEERITVVFRGSVTKNDYATDANIKMIHVPDPSMDHGVVKNSGNNQIGVHQGFYEYLFGSKSGKLSKYDQIIGHVHKLFQDPNRMRHYKLYVTGHGLGGALATLFGYYCASSSSKTQLPLPITIVSVASPRVGNLAFARSFTESESQAQLRHLRIAANKDPVTLGPFNSSKQPLSLGTKTFSPLGFCVSNAPDGVDGEAYYHTGMMMKLRKDIPATTSQRVEMSYSGANCVSNSSSFKSSSELDDKEELETVVEESKKAGSKILWHAIIMVRPTQSVFSWWTQI
jgi:hypothetical protein